MSDLTTALVNPITTLASLPVASDLQANLFASAPEILLLVSTLLVLLIDIFRPEGSTLRIDRVALAAIVPSILAVLLQLGTGTHYAFSGTYLADDFSNVLKLCAMVAVGVSFIYAGQYLEQRNLKKGEFYLLALFDLLGQMVMISAGNLLVVYVGLELLSLSMYAMAALRRDSVQAVEAAMKYFVLGALASGFLLYGMSMLYGGTGTLEIAAIAKKLGVGTVDRTVAFGAVFIVAGLAFKFGAVPFHMWVPDVYEGTPTAVTLLIAGAPKLAAFSIAFRILIEGLIGVAADWQPMLMMLAVASIVIGNVVAIAQTNIKRMLAYSTISHVGFVFLGLLSGVVNGDRSFATNAYSASMFYLIIYVLMTLGTFGVLMALARKGYECDQIDDLKGLVKRSPWLALVMLLLMFSMAGIPPLAGFNAKLVVLEAVIKAGYLWLAILAVMFSLVGAFYYLRIVKVMLFDAPQDHMPIEMSADSRAMLAVNGAMLVILGILPGSLMLVCSQAIRAALSS